ncbi:MAG: RNA polymerase sigma factor [Bacteroidales bacterium]|nr:RNA polymerase sigma factor [Bacteroidales bacterium]
MVLKKENCDKFDDDEIIKRSLENLDYFKCLYERYKQKLKHYIKRISFTSEEEADDILQEAFIKIWKNLHEYDSSLKLSSWLYRIVHNETISYIRAKHAYGKNNTIETDSQSALLLQAELDWEPDPEDIHSLTGKVLNKMPYKYRQFLIMKFFEKLSYEEISDILKLPEGTVATRINRAKKIFRKIAAKEHISFNR